MTRPLAQQARMLAAANDELALRPVRAAVDWGCIERIEAFRDLRRVEMGEARWSQLMSEWNA